MSSSDEDLFTIENITRRRKKPKTPVKQENAAKRSLNLDEISDSELNVFGDSDKEKKSSDFDEFLFDDMSVVEYCRRKVERKRKKEEQEILKNPSRKSYLDEFSSEDDEPKALPPVEPEDGSEASTSGLRWVTKRKIPWSKGTLEKKGKSSQADVDIIVLSDSEELESYKLPMCEDDPDEVLDIRYHVKDVGGATIDSFFYPSNKPLEAMREKFEDKMDPSLPYLYFFTDSIDPLDPTKTPIELGWNLDKVAAIRIQQSRIKAFHLSERKTTKIVTNKAEENLNDGRIMVKFGVKDRHKPFKVLISPTDKFAKIKAEFCAEQGFDPSKCFFEFDCERLKDDEAPNDKEIEAGDKIDVHVR
ncbi:hypothetical protein L596_001584 [Steinernema carpocapsae]|uniref:Ubiquitin-like domain-containing protein n=1 Tax=Steinernema carpocapsae TaxID=34508 RepID=A0A4U8ULY9_STECR|nr:hypothetical protein L596_001584 [Steinernema carpocapsae]